MNELVIMKNHQAITSSLKVAEVFKKNHRDVLSAIDDLKEGVAENYADLFWEDTYIHPQNKQPYRLIYMNRDGFTLLAMGFTGKNALEFKLEYIDQFNQMESHIKEQQVKLPSDPMEILALTFRAQEQTNERVGKVEQDIQEIKDNSLITTEDKSSIDRMVRKKVHAYCTDCRLGQEAKSMLFQDIGRSIKELFSVPHRGRIKAKDFQAVMEFLNTWEPTAVTKAKIKQLSLYDGKETA